MTSHSIDTEIASMRPALILTYGVTSATFTGVFQRVLFLSAGNAFPANGTIVVCQHETLFVFFRRVQGSREQAAHGEALVRIFALFSLIFSTSLQ